MLKCAVAVLFFLVPTTLEATDLVFERAADTALASPILPREVVENARDACETALCLAETLAAAFPDKVRLEPVAHPDTDSIRWVKTTPSVIAENTGGTRTLRITRFGRKAVAELREASAASSLLVDLSGNQGGDFERMLEIAGLLMGPRLDAIEIDHGDRVERRSLEGPNNRRWRVTHVRIDEKTASAALLLARLFAASGAELIGADRDEPIFLKRRLTVDHDWRLVLPVADVRVIASD